MRARVLARTRPQTQPYSGKNRPASGALPPFDHGPPATEVTGRSGCPPPADLPRRALLLVETPRTLLGCRGRMRIHEVIRRAVSASERRLVGERVVENLSRSDPGHQTTQLNGKGLPAPPSEHARPLLPAARSYQGRDLFVVAPTLLQVHEVIGFERRVPGEDGEHDQERDEGCFQRPRRHAPIVPSQKARISTATVPHRSGRAALVSIPLRVRTAPHRLNERRTLAGPAVASPWLRRHQRFGHVAHGATGWRTPGTEAGRLGLLPKAKPPA